MDRPLAKGDPGIYHAEARNAIEYRGRPRRAEPGMAAPAWNRARDAGCVARVPRSSMAFPESALRGRRGLSPRRRTPKAAPGSAGRPLRSRAAAARDSRTEAGIA